MDERRPHVIEFAGSKLRASFQGDNRLSGLFTEAEKLATSIFEDTKSGRAVVPFFTAHNVSHLQHVEQKLDAILFPEQRGDNPLEPSPEEAMYLLSAVWLHDIGMVYGIFPGEELGRGVDWAEVRDVHEQRAAQFVLEHWKDYCSWEHQEKIFIAQLCIYHRQRHSLSSMDPVSIRGRKGPVRLRELAAVLRLADACHIDATRAPGDLKNLYESVGMPTDSKIHWGMPKLIQDVIFDHKTGIIRPDCIIPPAKAYGTVMVDFRPVVDLIVAGLQTELDGIVPYLASFSNTEFREVEPNVSTPLALQNPQKYILDLWPYMLTRPVSASEVASMVAVLGIALVSGKTQVDEVEFTELLDHAQRLHPYNFLVRRLRSELKQMLCEKPHPVDVQRRLQAYLQARSQACQEVAIAAKRALQLEGEEILVVHGYSHNVVRLFEDHLYGHRGRILIVQSVGNTLDNAQSPDEAEILEKKLLKLQFNCRIIPAASLPTIFSLYQRQSMKVVVLLGARGIFNGGDVLSGVGTATVALAANAFDLPVYILAEEDKRLSGDDLSAEIEDALKSLASDLVSKPEPNLAIQVDRIEPENYHSIICSTGAMVFKRHEASTEVARPIEPLSPGDAPQA